ncbi:SGNH/GDSL hydrolase family protein [Alteromonas sp. 5E99-2]|uniref:SGNH/GDSL hydrolase family protein n=1 Tax=Alteromonas sp. 5E99-2 TaxID=2817683 RepID=UPI001A9800AC|nr:SGNH/GDSL hydrolase family protein [Alteromonas sp. 5E99-2]MBO1256852.1 SGNH/GDSL hydrolase family protein [Alteromonas sp. 5E99-2]
MKGLLKLSKHLFKAKKKLLVMGDSHVSVFNHKILKKALNDYKLTALPVGGATVSGLENPNSKTQALPLFMAEFEKIEPDITILQLGEVDTGFVIWYRAEKYKVPVVEMMDKAISNYKKLIVELSQKSQIVCISTPLPTIKDDQTWGEIANARKDITATQKERTDLTIAFNKAIEKICADEEVQYINLDVESLGDNGVVADYLLNSDLLDHHYAQDVYATMLANKLNETMLNLEKEVE